MSFRLQKPLKEHWRWGYLNVSQLFGENANNFYKKLGLKGHNGIDFTTSHFDKNECPVFAAHDGYVISDKTIQSDTAGRFVKILSEEVEIDGKKCKVESCYFHLKEARVSITDDEKKSWIYKIVNKSKFIKAGSLIGTAGNTGKYTTGPHLHFHIRVYWKQPDGTFKVDYDNGYDGCIDPMPLLKDSEVYVCYGRYFYNGKEISNKLANKILKSKQ